MDVWVVTHYQIDRGSYVVGVAPNLTDAKRMASESEQRTIGLAIKEDDWDESDDMICCGDRYSGMYKIEKFAH
jgi:hypothetical protein